MCMLSVLTGYGQARIADNAWSRQTWDAFKSVADQTAKLDEQLGEPDCIDPEKQAWMDRIEARLVALEAAQFRADTAA